MDVASGKRRRDQSGSAFPEFRFVPMLTASRGSLRGGLLPCGLATSGMALKAEFTIEAVVLLCLSFERLVGAILFRPATGDSHGPIYNLCFGT